MAKKMLLYTTPDGDIPPQVRQSWQKFAVEYAAKHNLDTIEDPKRWEVPVIIPGAFPAVGLLLYQHENQYGNNRKVIIQAGYKVIMEVQKKVGRLDGCKEIDYEGGMAVPLHMHPKLVYSINDRGDSNNNVLIGSVVDEAKNEQGTLYRVRSMTSDGRYVESRIYSEVRTPDNVQLLQRPSGIKLAELHTIESKIDMYKLVEQGYPKNINPLDQYCGSVEFKNILDKLDPTKLATVRTGKQEQFIGHSNTPMLLGSIGGYNLDKFGITIPNALEDNIPIQFRHLEELHKGEVSGKVDWHWLMTGYKTAVVGELSGKPDLGKGSEDAGDLFFHSDDPLFLLFLRTKIEEGH